MAGELSKKIGDLGEKLAEEFISKLGWEISESNVNIDCDSPSDHKKSKTDRSTHGIDFIVAYDCPIVPSTRRNILISMKNSHMEETNGQATKVKDDLKELDWAMNCYKRSSLRNDINRDSEASIIEDEGILIKINKDKDASESFLNNLKSNERIHTSQENVLHFIENKRFDHVDLCLKFLASERNKGNYSYFYPSNTHTYAADIDVIEGSLIPIQHLIAAPLTFRYVENETKEFIVFSPSEFDTSTFDRLVGLAYGCSNGWASKVTIIFPDLTVDQHESANKSLRGIRSPQLKKSITLESLDIRSRTP